MASGYIFTLHVLLLVYAFISYKKESIGEGFLAIAFVCIIFAVGWTIATMLTNLLFAFDWFMKWYWQPLDSWVWRIVRKEISRDTISLIILTGGEVAFYYFYFLAGEKSTDVMSDSTIESNHNNPSKEG
jgi:hypothetical protein